MTPRARRIGGIVLLVLAALLVPVAVVATWAARTVTDTDAFVARVTPVASTPEVQALIEQEMTEQITTAVIDDRAAPLVDGAIDSMSAPPLVKNLLRDLAAGVGSAVESRTASVVTKVVEAPEFAQAFEDATRIAHTDLVATLEGETNGTIVTEGDTVSIKLATVGNAVRAQLVNAGFSFVDRIPPLEASIPIATVEQLNTWQGYYQLLKVLVWLGPLLVVAFAAAGVWLVRDLVVAGRVVRRRGAARPGAAVTIGVRAVVSGATDRLTDPVAADAARAVVATFTDSLGAQRDRRRRGADRAARGVGVPRGAAPRRTEGHGAEATRLRPGGSGEGGLGRQLAHRVGRRVDLLAHDDVRVDVEGVERDERDRAARRRCPRPRC